MGRRKGVACCTVALAARLRLSERPFAARQSRASGSVQCQCIRTGSGESDRSTAVLGQTSANSLFHFRYLREDRASIAICVGKKGAGRSSKRQEGVQGVQKPSCMFIQVSCIFVAWQTGNHPRATHCSRSSNSNKATSPPNRPLMPVIYLAARRITSRQVTGFVLNMGSTDWRVFPAPWRNNT